MQLALAGCGGASPPPAPILEFVAGSTTGPGNADGTAATARFRFPMGVACDDAGNAYVADTDNDTIRRITAAGRVTTLAGTAGAPGSADGAGAQARFDHPQGVAADRFGNVYVADTGNHTIRRIAPRSEVTTLAGTAGTAGRADGIGTAAGFFSPQGLATDFDGNVYVADTVNNTIRRITPAGRVTTLAGTAGMIGTTDGAAAAALFDRPQGVAVDRLGNVYVADTQNYTARKITPAGQVSTLAGSGLPVHADGSRAAAGFFNPGGVAVDASGTLYVGDFDTLRSITPAGEVTTLAGTPGAFGDADGSGTAASFWGLQSISIDASGKLCGADIDNNSIRRIAPSGEVVKLAGGGPDIVGNVDGTGKGASFYYPEGLAIDAAGNMYVADTDDNTIRMITPAGAVTTFAGVPGVFGSFDGPRLSSSFFFPQGLAMDSQGNLYVADTYNDTIRKITPAGQVTTLAGTPGVSGDADGSGAEASFNAPLAVATDASGNVYVADTGNYTIRRIAPDGRVTTLAGTPGYSASVDGAGGAAVFTNPQGLAVDGVGNLYIADGGALPDGRPSSTIRKMTPARRVTTLAGTPGATGHADGAGASARFDFAPYFTPAPATIGMAVDRSGNLYVSDTGNSTVRRITPGGAVSTIAGHAGVAGFEPGYVPGILNSPTGLGLSGSTLDLAMRNAIVRVTHLP